MERYFLQSLSSLREKIFPGSSDVKNLPANVGDIRDTGQENPFKKDVATHYSILAWEMPWTEETDEL